MRIAVIAVPQFTQGDLDWIDRIRSKYDPQRNVVAPHFTLVFPFEDGVAELVLKHTAQVASQVSQAGPLSFILRSALASKDAFTALSHVFLIPHEGFSAIVALHENLNSDCLTPTTRPDIKFIPHVTVAAFEDPEQANTMADSVNAEDLAIRGTIIALDVLELDGRSVTEIAHIDLLR